MNVKHCAYLAAAPRLQIHSLRKANDKIPVHTM